MAKAVNDDGMLSSILYTDAQLGFKPVIAKRLCFDSNIEVPEQGADVAFVFSPDRLCLSPFMLDQVEVWRIWR